ncbi:MAG: hypothetical protein ACRC3G_00440 [Bacteroidales bacterium]
MRSVAQRSIFLTNWKLVLDTFHNDVCNEKKEVLSLTTLQEEWSSFFNKAEEVFKKLPELRANKNFNDSLFATTLRN